MTPASTKASLCVSCGTTRNLIYHGGYVFILSYLSHLSPLGSALLLSHLSVFCASHLQARKKAGEGVVAGPGDGKQYGRPAEERLERRVRRGWAAGERWGRREDKRPTSAGLVRPARKARLECSLQWRCNRV